MSMAKSGGNAGGLVLVGVVAVVGVALILSSKAAKAVTGPNLGVKEVPPLPTNKPTINIDADDEGEPVPRMLEQVEPTQAAQMPDRYIPGVVSMPPEATPEGVDAVMPPSRATADAGGRWSVTNDDGSPVQVNAAVAKQKAQSIADHVRTKKAGYDRPKLAVWQALAGLGVDGLYGPSTQKALSKFGAKNVPKALFKGGK